MRVGLFTKMTVYHAVYVSLVMYVCSLPNFLKTQPNHTGSPTIKLLKLSAWIAFFFLSAGGVPPDDEALSVPALNGKWVQSRSKDFQKVDYTDV